MNKLEEIYNRYIKIMLYSANKILGDSSLAEDAVQAAFEKIIRHPDKVLSIPIDDLKPYLIVVSENAARRLYHDRNKIPETPLDDIELFEPRQPGQEDISIDKLTLATIFQLSAFTPQFRDIIVLRYYYDLSIREISKTLGISEVNVRVRLTRAKLLMRQLIEKGDDSCD